MRRNKPTPVSMRKIKNPKFQTINGFIVANHGTQEMGGLWDDFTSTISNTATKVINQTQTQLQQKAESEVNQLLNKITGTTSQPVTQTGSSTIQVTGQSLPDQTYQQYFNAPMPQWLKYTLYGLGGVAGLLLIITLIRLAMNAGKKA